MALLAVMTWRHRWISDDALVYLRVARNIATGHGPVFNLGQRVEVMRSPLWTGLLAGSRIFAGIADPEWIAFLGSLVLAEVGLALGYYGASKLWSVGVPGNRRSFPLGLLVLVAFPPIWDYVASGIETGLLIFWMGAVVAVLGGATTRPSGPSIWSGVIVGLGPLIAPECWPVTVAGFVVLLCLLPTRGRGLRVVGAGAAAPVLIQLGRMAYYGQVVALPVLREVRSSGQLPVGTYLMDATDPYLLYIPVALIVAVIAVYWALIGREARLVVGALSVAAAAQLAWVALVGGGTAHAFAILPCLITLTMMVAVVPDTMTVGRWMAAIAVPWAVLSIFVLRPTLTDLDPPTMVAPPATDTRRFTTRGDGPGRPYIESKRAAMVLMTGEPHPVGHGAHERAVAFDLGRRVAAETASSGPFFAVSTSPDGQGQATYVRFPGPEPDRTTVVSASPGLASAGSDGRVDVTDAFGVVDSFGPRVWGQARHTALGPALPLAWTIARYSPTGTVVPESLRGPYLGEQIVEDARRSLRCAPLSDLDAAITSEVSASRLLRNLVASASLTWTRVPASPGRGC